MIKDILKKLQPNETAALIYAIEEEFSFKINLPDKHWIGVNIVVGPNGHLLEQDGAYSYGIFIPVTKETTC